MYENITPEEHKAQVAALNHEICRLSMKLREQEEAISLDSTIDCNNPFDNPTEYPGYNGDYRDIVPQIEIPGCVIPVEPHTGEKKRLKKFYSIGGSCIFFHFLFSTVISTVIIGIIMFILQLRNPGSEYNDLYMYAYSSSYLISKTRDFSFGKAVNYCFIAIFIQYAAAAFTLICSSIFSQYGYETNPDTSGMASTGMGMIVLAIYQCIIAPITEELFYRGMVLKTFSRANQRFAIVASAIFFGLAHGNLPQFMLAFLLGMFLAHIDIKHNSILPSIIVHFFINTLAMALNAISQYCGKSTIFISEIIYLIAAAAGLAMFICFTRKNMIPRTTPQQSRRGFAVAKTSLMVIAAFTALFGQTILTIVSTKLNAA